jgi:hypothetical protein
MDDFHVGSILPYAPEQDDVVSLSDQADPASEPVQDYYTPSQPPEEQK